MKSVERWNQILLEIFQREHHLLNPLVSFLQMISTQLYWLSAAEKVINHWCRLTKYTFKTICIQQMSPTMVLYEYIFINSKIIKDIYVEKS